MKAKLQVGGDLDNVDIAVIGLYRRGGGQMRVETEDVALECFSLAPQRFSWKKYPQYPETEPARSALFDARKAKHGGLVKGDNRKGWMLTPAGIDHAKALLESAGAPAGEEARGKPERQRVQRYLNALEGHVAFHKFRARGNCEGVERHEFTDFLRCTVDTTAEVLRERFETVKSRAHDANRTQLLNFLACCEERFGRMLAGTGGGERPQ